MIGVGRFKDGDPSQQAARYKRHALGLFLRDWCIGFADASTIRRVEIERWIDEATETQVKAIVGEWGHSNCTTRFVENLKIVIQQNEVLREDAQIRIDSPYALRPSGRIDNIVLVSREGEE